MLLLKRIGDHLTYKVLDRVQLSVNVWRCFFHPIIKCEMGDGSWMIVKGEVSKENGLDNWNATESSSLSAL